MGHPVYHLDILIYVFLWFLGLCRSRVKYLNIVKVNRNIYISYNAIILILYVMCSDVCDMLPICVARCTQLIIYFN